MAKAPTLHVVQDQPAPMFDKPKTREELMALVADLDREALDEFYASLAETLRLADRVAMGSKLPVGVCEIARRIHTTVEPMVQTMKALEVRR